MCSTCFKGLPEKWWLNPEEKLNIVSQEKLPKLPPPCERYHKIS